jgi:recombination protein RecA
MAPPFRQAEFDILYGQGISKAGDIIDLGVEQKLVEKSGTWYSYGDVRLGQGRENAKAYIIENPKIMDELEKKIREKHELELSPKEKPAKENPKEGK